MKSYSVILSIFGTFFAFLAQASFSGVDILSGSNVELRESGTKGTVFVFLSARCPCSMGHEAALIELHREFSQKGFRFYGIHSNQNESLEETRAHFAKSRLPFPVIHDPGAKLANDFRALKTPHVFIRREGISLFEGGVDDTASGKESKKQYLRNALVEIESGRSVTQNRVRVLGCAISRDPS